MKRSPQSFVLFCAALVMVMTLYGCSFFVSIFGSRFEVDQFYDQSKEALPQFAVTTSRSVAMSSSESNGVAISRAPKGFYDDLMASMPDSTKDLFYFLMSWDSPDGVDRSNLYRLLYDVQELSNRGYAAITPTTITMPFPKITTDVVYTHAYTDSTYSGLMKDNGTVLDAAVSWVWPEALEPSKMSYGNFVAKFDRSSSDITIDFAYSVDYDTSDDAMSPMAGDTGRGYSRRTIIDGNSSTNFFQIQASAGFVGMGYSQGSGKYMLMKLVYNDVTKYLVIPSEGANETWFRDRAYLTPDGSTVFENPDDLPATVSAYKAWVVSTPLLVQDDVEIISSAQLQGEGEYGIQIVY